MTSNRSETPLFPLKTVLFPGGPLVLRVFEPRYLDMVSRCMNDSSSFAVVAIDEGSETGPASIHAIGTSARIVDWYQERDGILGIVAIGHERLRIDDSWVQADGLRVGNTRRVEAELPHAVPERFMYMADLMESIIDDLGDQYGLIDRKFDDASWLGFRFAEILPISLADKQQHLESRDALGRLASLAPVLNALSMEN